MTLKFSENSLLYLRDPSEYIKIIKLYLKRYFRIRQPRPSNLIFTIFSKVYHTFGHTWRTRRNFLTPLMRQLSNRQLVLRVQETKIKKGVGAPFRKLDYISIAKARELKFCCKTNLSFKGPLRDSRR